MKRKSAVRSWKRSCLLLVCCFISSWAQTKILIHKCPLLEAVMSWSPWKFGTADGCTQQTLMTALGMLLAHFPINYQLPHRVILVLSLQMIEGESTAIRTTGMAGWSHESSWCVQRPRNFGHLISQNSFCYYSVRFIWNRIILGTLSRQNLHCCCSSLSSSS